MADSAIHGLPNGSILVPGPIRLVKADGEEVRIERAAVGLCRCEGSQNKPLCDGIHRGIAFEADESFVTLEP